MRECIPPNLHDPQRAKGSLDRRSKWFSLVPFFLQKKKGTRAGARNAPSRARRQCPHNTTAASAATYPLRCSAPQWARFDNRHSTSAPAPILSLHQRQRRKRYKRSPEPTTTPTAPIPRSQHRQIRTCPLRAKGSLNRRFEWFSLVTFFLQKKKVTRAGARNVPSRARRCNTCLSPRQGILRP